MQTQELLRQAKEIAELNKKRTQGKWDYDGEETIASQDWGGYGYSLFPVDKDGQCNGFIADFDLNEEDAAFCAAAPRMAELIAAMAEVIKYSQWKDVYESSPPESAIYAYFPAYEAAYLLYWNEDTMKHWGYGIDERYEFTHWMPLPTLPQPPAKQEGV